MTPTPLELVFLVVVLPTLVTVLLHVRVQLRQAREAAEWRRRLLAGTLDYDGGTDADHVPHLRVVK